MIKRFVVLLVTCAAAVVAMATAASAHDPIFVTSDQTTPETGPLLLDGEVSWAVYGTLDRAGDLRGFEFDLAEGARLDVSVLIPDLAPERDLDDADLPVVELTAPDGSVDRLGAEIRVPFDEPFSNTSYVRLAERDGEALAGRYQVVVTGAAPARFTVAVGIREQFGTPAERVVDRGGADLLSTWYETAPTLPAAEPDAAEVAPPTTTIATTETAGETSADESDNARWVVGVVVFGVVLVAAAAVFGRRRR